VEPTHIDRGDRHLAAFVHPGPPGAATVVCESGLGNDHYCWDKVAALLVPHASVVTYDRAGYGASPVSKERRTLAGMAADLAAVVAHTAPVGPVVLVGHSLGGRIARAAASTMPASQLHGLVLLEGAPDGIVADKPALDRGQRRFLRAMGLIGRTGVLGLGPVKRRLAARAGHTDADSEAFRATLASLRRASFGPTLLQEWASMHDAVSAHRPDVAAIELVAAGWDDWSESQRRRVKASAEELIAYIEQDFTRLYPDGELRRITGTGHGIETDRPDAVADAVLALLQPQVPIATSRED
jgi:pimeloyl-ACP methyl ester carboxylesterase